MTVANPLAVAHRATAICYLTLPSAPSVSACLNRPCHEAGFGSRDYCAGMVIKGSLSGLPVSASVKKNMTAVSARFVRQARSSTQNQWSR